MTEITEKQRKQRQLAARKHGIRALQERGPGSLVEPEKITRLAELRQLVRTNQGRADLRDEHTARTALIVEIAFSEIAKHVEGGKSLFTSPVIRRASTWWAEFRRCLDGYPAQAGGNGNSGELGHIDAILQEADGDDSQ